MDTTNFKTLLTNLNSTRIVCDTLDWEELIDENGYNEMFEQGFREVEIILEDSNRLYDISVAVIKIYNHYLGIRYVSSVHNNNVDMGEINFKVEYFEMKKKKKSTFEQV